MSTLIRELEQAAAGYEVLAKAPPGETIDAAACRDLAARLRRRIEHVKGLEATLQNPSYVDVTQVELDLFATLTGPLP